MRLTLPLFGLWLLLIVSGVVHFAVLEPTRVPYAYGANRFAALTLWHTAALLLAPVVWWGGRREPVRWRRWLSRLPVIWFVLLAAFFVGLIGYTEWQFSQGPVFIEMPDTRPVTEPSDPGK